MNPRPATQAQIRYLAALGVPESTAKRWNRREASAEIALRLARGASKPLTPVGPKLHGPPLAAPEPDYRLATSRALTGPSWL